MNEVDKRALTKEINHKTSELNNLLDKAKENNVEIVYNEDCDGHLRILSVKSTVTYYTHEDGIVR